ncbi:PA1571 family protein [Pseudomonas sp. L-22-4S-12]|uniref:PA1571 family protein n=1 Tax=Pseudomonas sp. L-22-4S-12 TaxID=2610893 RepID=UPI0015B6BAFF|nr:PA1571 family protein [Pseudomonas sp. L-22-4S-12]
MRLKDSSSNPQRVATLKPQQTVGGAFIDAQGREVPITEGMIQRACRELEKNWSASKQA